MDENFNMPRIIQRELTRAILELAQGEMYRHSVDKIKNDEQAPEGVTEELDIAYINRDGVPLAMDIIRPDVDDNVELPVIVTIHGGGLVFGDRRITRSFNRILAKAGYLTFSIEYRLTPRANVCEQLDDVCAGMDFVGKLLLRYNVDFSRVFLVAESAGAYLGTYVAAMKNSVNLQQAIGYKPTRMRFRALGFVSGMFYTQRNDPLGMLLSDQFYGQKQADEAFLRYMDPEHPEIVRNLPPVFFITSQGDFLNSYTIDYHDALSRAGKQTRLLYYSGKDLGHAFVTISPELEQSQDAIGKMLAWFEEQADKERASTRPAPEVAAQLAKVDERMANGEIAHQKAWEFIRELNSVNEARLDAIALRDGDRGCSYRQLFREQKRYARAFSSLGITQANNSRMGVMAGISPVPVHAFYALNMLGVPASMFDPWDVLSNKAICNLVKTEGITDLLLLDTCVDEMVLRGILRRKEELGLRHIIVAHSSEEADFADPFEQEVAHRKWIAIKHVRHVLSLTKLLRDNEETPIAYGNGESDEAAIIVHTSGTTKGTHKSVPLSDEAFNAAALRLFLDERMEALRSCKISLLNVPLHSATGMVDMLHTPFALGCTVVLAHDTLNLVAPMPDQAALIAREGVEMMLISPAIVDMLDSLPDQASFDFSGVKLLIFGGSSLTKGRLQRAREFFDECGGSPVIINGYGLTETTAAVIVNVCDPAEETDDGKGIVPVGYPLPGEDVLLRDTESGKWQNPYEGPCVGELYIHSISNSCGRLDDTTLFEHESVDGVPYLCTNDLASADETGCITCIGRANRYFVSYGGERFNAGIVEEAINAQDGIDSCAIVPCLERVSLHDTVPVLYTKVARDASQDSKAIVQRAFVEAYRSNERLVDSPLPWMCVIAEDLPLNTNGKVDIVRIMTQDISGDKYIVEAQKDDNGKLSHVHLQPVRNEQVELALSVAGIPEEVREERYEIARNFVRMYGLAKLPPPLFGYIFDMGRNWVDSVIPKGPDALFDAHPPRPWPPMMPPKPLMQALMHLMTPPKKKGAASIPAMFPAPPFAPVLPMPMMPPLPFMPGANWPGNDKEAFEPEGDGMIMPEPLNFFMRLLFSASTADNDYEE